MIDYNAVRKELGTTIIMALPLHLQRRINDNPTDDLLAVIRAQAAAIAFVLMKIESGQLNKADPTP